MNESWKTQLILIEQSITFAVDPFTLIIHIQRENGSLMSFKDKEVFTANDWMSIMDKRRVVNEALLSYIHVAIS